MKILNIYYLDASVLIKLVINEVASDKIRQYFNNEGVLYTTQYCLYEALGVLKVMWKYRNKISREEYFSACEDLLTIVQDQNIQIDSISLSNSEVFRKAEKISTKYDLDFSDSLQLVSLQFGEIAELSTTMNIILVTADEDLAKAANNEKLLSWYVINESIPSSTA